MRNFDRKIFQKLEKNVRIIIKKKLLGQLSVFKKGNIRMLSQKTSKNFKGNLIRKNFLEEHWEILAGPKVIL